MTTQLTVPLADLYLEDETAWLEAMAELIALGHFDDLDHANLREYLTDMAKRDRREVFHRLVLLLTHLLKWAHQPEKRAGSWRGTIREQRRELQQLLDSGTLRKHATAILATTYEEARQQAADETGLPVSSFPTECQWTVDELLTQDSLG